MFLVDWLGRGGIAQTSEAWMREARRLGLDVTVATRPGRELRADVAPERARHAILEHRELAHVAAGAIRDRRPELVVIQNYVLPWLEVPVYRAARAVGARVAVVVHDHRMHTSAAGTHHGLTGLLRGADDVLAHSHFVADRLSRRIDRSVTVIDIPQSLGMLDHAHPFDHHRPAVAVHFGVLKRKYKGTDLVRALAAAGVEGWDIAAIGGGGYTPSPDLVAAVERSGATLLPYRIATQSGAVVLAQSLGSIPIASAVGGIPEQIIDGVTGILVAPGASIEAWRRSLLRLADADRRRELAANGRAATAAAHDRFVQSLSWLAGAHV
jgi:glycosyltransferase involved in cell wall biosynthesis